MSTCSAGSYKPVAYSSIIAVLITDVCLLILWFSFKAARRNHWAKRDATYQEMTVGQSINPSLYTKGALYEQLPPHSKMLCQGFKRAQKSLPVMHLSFDDLSLTIPVKGKKGLTILKGVTGSIEPSKVTAIMGPSGAGSQHNTIEGAMQLRERENVMLTCLCLCRFCFPVRLPF